MLLEQQQSFYELARLITMRKRKKLNQKRKADFRRAIEKVGSRLRIQ